jgi:hypothetical protein
MLKAKGNAGPMYAAEPAKRTDGNREFKRQVYTEWQSFVIVLVVFAILDYLCLGLKAMK